MHFFRVIVVYIVVMLAKLNSVTSDTLHDWMMQIQQPHRAYLGAQQSTAPVQPISALTILHQQILQHMAEYREKLRQRSQILSVFGETQPNIGDVERIGDESESDGGDDSDDYSSDEKSDNAEFLLGKRNNKAVSSWVRSEYRGRNTQKLLPTAWTTNNKY